MNRRLGIAPLAALLIFGLAGCGPSAEDQAAEAEASAAAEASASASAAAEARAAQEAEAAAAAEEEWQACKDATADLYESLNQIDSRLDVGLNYGDLGDRLGDVMVAYNDLDFDAMEPKCTLNVGIALEDALNQYSKSRTKWGNCIDDYDCEVDGAVLRRMRKHWSEASERLEYVDKLLATPEAYSEATDLTD